MANHETLRDAWRRFGAFNTASVDHQKWFLRLRLGILIVGVATAAAGLASVAAEHAENGRWAGLQPWIRWLTFVSSLVLAALFMIAARFDRGSAWVVSRRTAELVLREIFLYRTGRGPYKTAAGAPCKVDATLAEQLRAVSRDAPRRFGRSKDGEFPPRVATGADGSPLVLAGNAPDDGLCPLAAADYLRLRLDQQCAWYGRKARRTRAALFAFQVAGVVVGLGGAALAFAGGSWIAWVAVTTAVAAAIASWSELRRLDATAAAYDHAAADLDDLRVWWHALSDAERASDDSFDKLVTECEAVIESENASWTQDMRKRVAELKAEAEQRAAAAGKSA
jgi:protein-S-isoprenylcysteine O-methyltransferase Ste14